MCFSAEASFIASGVLAGTGIAISRLPKPRSNLPIALIPAVFATHQLIEGFIWLKQDDPHPGPIFTGAIFGYVFIAYVFWPVFIPFAVYLLEGERWRRKWILFCQAAGLIAGLAYLTTILGNPVGVSVNSCSLSYQVTAPGILFIPYLIAVSVPFLVCSHRGLVLFGASVILACTAALYFATLPGFPSVWCFFAAFLSASLYLYFRAEARNANKVAETQAFSRPATG
jgi:hypothetical protein